MTAPFGGQQFQIGSPQVVAQQGGGLQPWMALAIQLLQMQAAKKKPDQPNGGATPGAPPTGMVPTPAGPTPIPAAPTAATGGAVPPAPVAGQQGQGPLGTLTQLLPLAAAAVAK